MPIPDFESIMLPLLKLVADEEEHRIGTLYGKVADAFGLSPEERQPLLPSKAMPVINNRTQWAKSYLVKACLLVSPRRGGIALAPKGSELLKGKGKGTFSIVFGTQIAFGFRNP